MKFKELKQAVETIELSDEMQDRIIRTCRASAVHKTEEIIMKNRVNFTFKKAVSIAAVIALCLCASVAANHFGAFRDITSWTGAVTGTEYVQATNEIDVSATVEQGVLTITAVFLSPDTAPYREEESLRIGRYQIVNASGKVVADSEGDAFVEIVDGVAVMPLSLDGTDRGTYTLRIHSFVGSKKADQPLNISGDWECVFTV